MRGASRPIGAASALFGSWLAAREEAPPAPQAAPFACKAETSVRGHAACSCLRARVSARAGMERDLSKCCDQ
eukprot:2244298-Pyramimonas_sp.AAC.1